MRILSCAKDPLIDIVGLQEKLERHFNRTFNHHYIKRLGDSQLVPSVARSSPRKNKRDNFRAVGSRQRPGNG
jgi:hypothetical protein